MQINFLFNQEFHKEFAELLLLLNFASRLRRSIGTSQVHLMFV